MEVFTLLVAIVALIVSAVAAGYARNSNQIAILAEFLREFREMEPARRTVIRELPKHAVVPVAELPDPLRADATQVCLYLDGLGLLVRRELVDEEPIYSIMGSPILRHWEKLSPYIEAERKARDEPRYMRGFEDLAERARTFDYDHDLTTLRRFAGTTTPASD